MRSTTKLKLLGLALALATSAGFVAVASRDANAYFSDAISGTMTGTRGSSATLCPYRLNPGTSKAQHWDAGACQKARVLPIAQRDSSGALFLDFGDVVLRNSGTSPDVFRIVSLVDEAHTVTLKVTGQMAAFVAVVRLDNSVAGVLRGRTTESVSIKIRVPDHAQPGRYSGTITVHVDGWADDTQLRMTIDVRSKQPAHNSAPDRHRAVPRKSKHRLAQTPYATTAPAAASAPASAQTPISTATPTPAPSGGANGV